MPPWCADQLHGGIGTTLEYSAGPYFKRLTSIDRTLSDADFYLSRFATQDAAEDFAPGP